MGVGPCCLVVLNILSSLAIISLSKRKGSSLLLLYMQVLLMLCLCSVLLLLFHELGLVARKPVF